LCDFLADPDSRSFSRFTLICWPEQVSIVNNTARWLGAKNAILCAIYI
jgi:hypothetical protein